MRFLIILFPYQHFWIIGCDWTHCFRCYCEPGFMLLTLFIYYYWYPIMSCNAFCVWINSISLLFEMWLKQKRVRLKGLYSPINTTAEVVATAQRGGSSDQKCWSARLYSGLRARADAAFRQNTRLHLHLYNSSIQGLSFLPSNESFCFLIFLSPWLDGVNQWLIT